MSRPLLVTTALATTMIAIPAAASAMQLNAPTAEAVGQPANPQDPAVATAVGEANAAPAPAAADGGIEDIIVTARRTEESLQTTPIAVTALGSQALVNAKVENVSDLQRTAPGLVVGRGSAGADSIVFVAIRGQGNLQPILANDPAVATYVDGVYIPRPSTGLTDIQDIQRVEVLRGPQGTLFGRNTTGGALNFISNDPTDEFTAIVKGEYGNYENLGLQGTVNAPIADGLALRVSGAYRDRDGYGRNPLNDRRFADTNSKFVRGKLRYEGDGFDVTLSGDWNKIRNRGQQVAIETFDPTNGTITALGYTASLTAALLDKSRWHQNQAIGTTPVAGAANLALFATLTPEAQALYGVLPFNRLEVYGFSGTINVELGAFKLKSVTGYRNSFNYSLSDTDAASAPLLSTFAGSGSDYISQELQISGDVTDSLSFIAGGYYGRESGYEFSRSQIFGGVIRDSNADATNKTFGLFAQAYYQLTPQLRAVGGFRYTWDKRNTVLHNAQVFGLPYDVPLATPTGINCTVTPSEPVTATTCNQIQNAKFDYPAWTAGLDYQVNDDLFVYFATRGAAKAGGWNLRAGGLPAFSPEKVKDIEAGLKVDLFDRRVRFNTALFHTWKDDNQAIVNAFVPGIGVTQYIQNNGKVRIWGIENELTVVPWEGMTVGANFALQDGKYKTGSFSEIQVVPGSGCTNASGVLNGCVVDLSDLPLLQLPKRQVNISATQRLPLGNGNLSVTGAYAYVSSQVFNTVLAAPQQPAVVQERYARTNELGRIPGYGVFNGRVAYKFDGPNLEVAAYGRNIFGNKYLIRRFSDLYNQGLGFSAAYVGEPATYGIEVTFGF